MVGLLKIGAIVFSVKGTSIAATCPVGCSAKLILVSSLKTSSVRAGIVFETSESKWHP